LTHNSIGLSRIIEENDNELSKSKIERVSLAGSDEENKLDDEDKK